MTDWLISSCSISMTQIAYDITTLECDNIFWSKGGICPQAGSSLKTLTFFSVVKSRWHCEGYVVKNFISERHLRKSWFAVAIPCQQYILLPMWDQPHLCPFLWIHTYTHRNRPHFGWCATASQMSVFLVSLSLGFRSFPFSGTKYDAQRHAEPPWTLFPIVLGK